MWDELGVHDGHMGLLNRCQNRLPDLDHTLELPLGHTFRQLDLGGATLWRCTGLVYLCLEIFEAIATPVQYA